MSILLLSGMHRSSHEDETKNEAPESSTRGIISIGETL